MKFDMYNSIIDEGIPLVAITYPLNRFDAVYIDESNKQRAIEYINNKKIKKVMCILADISCLKECPDIEHLSLGLSLPDNPADFETGKEYIKFLEKLYLGGRIKKINDGNYKYLIEYDFAPLYHLKSLRSIRIGGDHQFVKNQASMDVSSFDKLEEIDGDIRYYKNIEIAISVRSFSLHPYKPKCNSLDELRYLKKLDSLKLISSNIRSLKGIENFGNFTCLNLISCRSIEDIDDLLYVKNSIKALHIETCPRIEDFSVLGSLENLQELRLIGSNKIPNISFIKTMKGLKSLYLGINVLDGDISPCDGLEHVGIKDRQHYNRKNAQMPHNIHVKTNVYDPIDEWRRVDM